MKRRQSQSSEGNKLRNVSLAILFSGLIAACFADINIYTSEPWHQLALLLQGFLTPSISSGFQWREAMVATLAFAILGVSFGALLGFFLSLLFHFALIRYLCAFFRAIHELFWALIFMQIFGLSTLTGVLAITIPFACIFARVFSDIYRQSPIQTQQLFSHHQKAFSQYIYLLMPQVWPQMKDYIGYRLECAIRTSTVLGFIGLPTLGFYLETSFKQANYSLTAGLILSLLALVFSIKYWFRSKFLPVYAIAAWLVLPSDSNELSLANISRFFTLDIWPALPGSSSLLQKVCAYGHWAQQEMLAQGWQGIGNTLILTLMAVALTWLAAIITLPWLAKTEHSPLLSAGNRTILLVMRSVPEYILAFVLLLLFGPSMLPGVFALAIHNNGLISFLMAQRISRLISGRKKTRVSDYYYRIQPEIYTGFLALLLYRAEIILRESAILGILGITTLGFYIDSAFEDFRLDRAFLLLMITALLNIILDYSARKIQTSITLLPAKHQSR